MILAIDPGPNTGIARWYDDHLPGHEFQFETLPLEENGHSLLYDFVHAQTIEGDTVVLEKFEFRKTDQTRDKINYIPAEYVGVVKACHQKENEYFTLVLQSPSQAVGDKAFWNNDKLKALGLYKPGTDNRHEMDALRHLLYYVTFTLKDNRFLLQLK